MLTATNYSDWALVPHYVARKSEHLTKIFTAEEIRASQARMYQVHQAN
jgi:hypothetical protein